MNLNSYQNLPSKLSLDIVADQKTARQVWDIWQQSMLRYIQNLKFAFGKNKRSSAEESKLSFAMPDTGNPILDLYCLEGMKLFKQGPYAAETSNSKEEY